MNSELRPLWARYLTLNWKFGLFLLSLVCIPRFILVLKANETGNYSTIGIVMFLSALVPFIFLNKFGRKQIGLKSTNKIQLLILALVAGLLFSIILYFIGQTLYGTSSENWYGYIGKSYNIPEGISGQGKIALFTIMAITGMTFSPIGEELFFRGIVHRSFAKSVGAKKASIIDSLAFALTHISHFGLVFVNDRWTFHFTSTAIWVISMFSVSILFFQMKKRTDSLWGAILCHAGFNLGMIYCIFYLI